MSDSNDRQAEQAGQERRTELRVPASTLGEVTTRLVGVSDLTLLNYTSRGLYGQSTSRLLVGARISVRLATATLNAVVAGRVVRASLTHIVEGVPRYEVAVMLERDVDWGTAPGREPEPEPEPVREPEPEPEPAHHDDAPVEVGVAVQAEDASYFEDPQLL